MVGVAPGLVERSGNIACGLGTALGGLILRSIDCRGGGARTTRLTSTSGGSSSTICSLFEELPKPSARASLVAGIFGPEKVEGGGVLRICSET